MINPSFNPGQAMSQGSATYAKWFASQVMILSKTTIYWSQHLIQPIKQQHWEPY